MVAILLAVVATNAIAAEPLRWQLAEGEQWRWTAKQTVTTRRQAVTATGPAKPLGAVVTVVLHSLWTVEAVGKAFARPEPLPSATAPRQDTALIRVDLQRLQLTMNTPPGAALEYDSAKPPAADDAPALREVADQFKTLIGAVLYVRMTSRGEILDAAESQAGQQSGTPKPQATRPLADADPAGLRQIVRGGFPLLPERTSRAGAEWRDRQTLDSPLGPLLVQRVFRLGPTTDQQELRPLRLRGFVSLQPPPGGPPPAAKIVSQQWEGEYNFDIRRGKLSRSRVTQSLVIERSLGQERERVQTDSSLEASAEAVLSGQP
ncbi:MAG: hypothetical protein KDB14_17460 [Planctomycetales bacterium]|nr:hypothetical protein [Planctomycetales bacterium]